MEVLVFLGSLKRSFKTAKLFGAEENQNFTRPPIESLPRCEASLRQRQRRSLYRPRLTEIDPLSIQSAALEHFTKSARKWINFGVAVKDAKHLRGSKVVLNFEHLKFNTTFVGAEPLRSKSAHESWIRKCSFLIQLSKSYQTFVSGFGSSF